MSDACEECGCTDEHACPGGCSWVRRGLCSQCQDAQLLDLVQRAGEWLSQAPAEAIGGIQAAIGRFPCLVIAGGGRVMVKDHLKVPVFMADREGAYLALQYRAAEVQKLFEDLIGGRAAA